MNRMHMSMVALGAAVAFAAAGCASSRCGAAFAEYDGATEVKVMELKRTSRSWDGAEERFIAFSHSFFIFMGEKCVGYVLCLESRNSIPRAATLMTKKGVFTPPAALLLTDSVLTSFRKAGVEKYEASVINEQNRASFSILEHVNARKIRLYTQFIKNIQ